MAKSYSFLEVLKELNNRNDDSIPTDDVEVIDFNVREELNQELKISRLQKSFNKDTKAIVTLRKNLRSQNWFFKLISVFCYYINLFNWLKVEDSLDSIILWKNNEEEELNVLKISNDSDGVTTNYCTKFLLSRLKDGDKGILNDKKNKKHFRITDIETKNGHNLLILAVLNNEQSIVEKLVKYNFDINTTFITNGKKALTVIDKAWNTYSNTNDFIQKTSANKIIIILLSANAKFPKKFDYKIASKEVQEFTDLSRNLHSLVENKQFNDAIDKVKSLKSNLKYFYDENNQSLLLHALKRSLDSKILSLLENECKLSEADNEAEERFKYCSQIRNSNQESAVKFKETHLHKLLKKSHIDSNINYEYYRSLIKEAFKSINSNESCKKILTIAATFKNLEIYFDFKNTTTYYFDPTTTNYTKGVYIYRRYSNIGKIEIGAKNLLSKNNKASVYGTIIHELTHLVMNMTFLNNCNPYKRGESQEKEKFKKIVFDQCKANQHFEEIVGWVFGYEDEALHAELIVRPYHMMMSYFKDKSKINDCKAKFSHLFDYVTDVVEPELDKALPVLHKLYDDDQELKYSELTALMKEQIWNAKINFQGVLTSLYDVLKVKVNEDEEKVNESVLDHLPSKIIKGILMRNETLSIGKAFVNTTQYVFINREFVTKCEEFVETPKKDDETFKEYFENTIEYAKQFKNSTKKFYEIEERVKSSKFFILAGKSGDGKTQAFEDLAKRLKLRNKNYLVLFIKLKEHINIFEKLKLLKNQLNLEQVYETLNEIVFPRTDNDLNWEFYKNVFRHLFFTDQVILLLDGFDEICPKFNELIVKLISILRKETSNQIWLSTRSKYEQQLKEIKKHPDDPFNTSYYLRPFDITEKEILIEKVLQNSEISKTYVKNNELKTISHFLVFNNGFNNPFFIKEITRLYASKGINLGHDFDNYLIYNLLITEQMSKNAQHIETSNCNVLKSFTIERVHQVLALKFMFNVEQTENLSIIKQWKREKKNWTEKEIERFGIATANLENEDRKSIDFLHYSYAEFFVDKYFIDMFFSEDKCDEEMEKNFTLFENYYHNFRTNSFWIDFLLCHWDSEEQICHPKIKELANKEKAKEIDENVVVYLEALLKFLPTMIKNNPEVFKFIKKELFGFFLTRFIQQGNKRIMTNDIFAFLGLMEMPEQFVDMINSEINFFTSIFDRDFHKSLVFMLSCSEDHKNKDFIKNIFITEVKKDMNLYNTILSKIEPDDLIFLGKLTILSESSVDILTLCLNFLKYIFEENINELKNIILDKETTCHLNKVLTSFDQNFKYIMDFYVEFEDKWIVFDIFLCGSNFHKIFMASTGDNYYIFIEYIIDSFESDKNKLFKYAKMSPKYVNLEYLQRLEILIEELYFYEEEENKKEVIKEGIREILMNNGKFILPLDDQSHDFQSIKEFYEKYQDSPDEILSYLVNEELD